MEPSAGNNAVIQLHSDSGRYTINAQHSDGDYQVYDNDNGRSVFRYLHQAQSTTFNTDFNIPATKLYKINDIQIDSEDILYVSSATDTLKTKIDSKQDILTFGKSDGNALKLQENVVTNDILLMGTNNVVGVTYSQLKTSLNLNLVDNISDLNKVISTATQNALNLKANLASPTFTGVLSFTGSRIDLEPAAGSNAVIQLHSDSGRYTINANHSNGDYQVYDNDNGRSVFRYFQASQSTTFNTDFNIPATKLYKINDIQIDSEDILYVSSAADTLKTKIDLKANLASPTFTGTISGPINPYITTTSVDYDQPIVQYKASGVVPTPPANLALIIPTTNFVTVNSSTGLLKSKSIQVTGDITNVSNFTATTVNSTTLNTGGVNATDNIDAGDNSYFLSAYNSTPDPSVFW